MTEQYEKILSKWDSMTPRERDALIAEKVMGWKRVFNPKGFHVWVIRFSEDGRILLYEREDEWNPSENISVAFEVEAKAIEEDPAMYVHALASVVFGYNQVQDISDIRKMCMLIHATPEQRCKAALLAVMEL